MDARLKGLCMGSALLLLAARNGAPKAEKAEAAQPAKAAAPLTGEVPAEVIVSTNEPFQSALVQDGQILLKSPDHPDGQVHAVTSVAASRTAENARRSWSGSGADGEVQVEARSGPCLDSMSGAKFPLSGAITVGGVRTEGCARPAGTPPPPEPTEG